MEKKLQVQLGRLIAKEEKNFKTDSSYTFYKILEDISIPDKEGNPKVYKEGSIILLKNIPDHLLCYREVCVSPNIKEVTNYIKLKYNVDILYIKKKNTYIPAYAYSTVLVKDTGRVYKTTKEALLSACIKFLIDKRDDRFQ